MTRTGAPSHIPATPRPPNSFSRSLLSQGKVVSPAREVFASLRGYPNNQVRRPLGAPIIASATAPPLCHPALLVPCMYPAAAVISLFDATVSVPPPGARPVTVTRQHHVTPFRPNLHASRLASPTRPARVTQRGAATCWRTTCRASTTRATRFSCGWSRSR
jgi:hypothetical protein